MVDVTQLAAIRDTTTIKQSHTSWGIRFGRHEFEVTRTREARAIGQHTVPFVASQVARPIWPLAIGTFASVSAFGLFVFGAVASEPLLPGGRSHYSVSVPVPALTSKVSVAVPSRRATNRAKDRSVVPILAVASGPRFDAEDESYVAKALRSGEFQEWLGSDGQRRFLNAGPEQAEGGERCRDLALLVRRTDGSSRTRSARRCIGGSAPSTAMTANSGEMDQAASSFADQNASNWTEPPSARADGSAVEWATEQ